METLLRDIRDAARSLKRNRRFVAAAIVAAALGIGANTATFSVVHAVLLRPLPYPEPDRVVGIWATAPDRSLEYTNVSFQRFRTIAEASHSFASVAAYTRDTVRLTSGSEPTELRALRVSQSFLDVLGVSPVMGRNFTTDEDQTGGDDVVILTSDVWARTFGSAPGILGSTLTIDGRPHKVVGILPPSFVFPGVRGDVLVPRPNEPGFLTAGAVERGCCVDETSHHTVPVIST